MILLALLSLIIFAVAIWMLIMLFVLGFYLLDFIVFWLIVWGIYKLLSHK